MAFFPQIKALDLFVLLVGPLVLAGAGDLKLLARKRLPPGRRPSQGAGPGSAIKEAFANADFVIEAVFEELSIKKHVFAEVEAVVRPDCVPATNTSSLSRHGHGGRPATTGMRGRLPFLQPRGGPATAGNLPTFRNRCRDPGHRIGLASVRQASRA
jgi:hypothetical protein